MKNPYFDKIGHSRALVSLNRIQKNYKIIEKLCPDKKLMPMLKADAYGHGALTIAKKLKSLKNLYGFGVAYFEEAIELRNTGNISTDIPIIVFSGSSHWNSEKHQLCSRFGIRPIISSVADLCSFCKLHKSTPVKFELKFNTGMNRLGIDPEELTIVQKLLRDKKISTSLMGIGSHFAVAESPHSNTSQTQVKRFKYIAKTLHEILKGKSLHMANSAGIWNFEKHGIDLTTVVRPGLSLYGVPPWKGAPTHGIQFVMEVQYRVLATRTVAAGETIGYGASFKVGQNSRKSAIRIGIAGGGYADGLLRSFQNDGALYRNKLRLPIVGRVNMDLIAFQFQGREIKANQWISSIGRDTDIWDIAQNCGTIPYELLTSVSRRVPRIFK